MGTNNLLKYFQKKKNKINILQFAFILRLGEKNREDFDEIREKIQKMHDKLQFSSIHHIFLEYGV